jgi:DNA-binding IclR family transcriptional regulator
MLGYLERFPESKQYRLTLKPLELGFNAIARMDLRTIAQPELRALVGTVREAASIGILDRDEVVYIERYQEGQARLGVDIRVGSAIWHMKQVDSGHHLEQLAGDMGRATIPGRREIDFARIGL